MAAKLYQILISALPEVKSFHDLAIRWKKKSRESITKIIKK
jgi:hypothetical protein